jgi:hypothetical protein
MTDYIKILNYYEDLASNTFSLPGIIFGIIAAIIILLILVSVIGSVSKSEISTDFVIFLSVLAFFLPIYIFFSFATGIKSTKDLDKPEYLAEVKKYNINSLKNLKDNINLLREEMKFGTSNSDEEINKILNEFYKPKNKNQNNDDKLIKKLKN